MNDLKLQYYKVAFLQMKRGNHRGVFSNAKPVLCLAYIEAIEQGMIKTNEIQFIDSQLKELYESVYKLYCKDTEVTPIEMPFFHLNKESFYSIEWKSGVQPPMQAHSPSFKYLRENVKCAHFDNALWDLLQDTGCRQALREVIIQNFLTRHQSIIRDIK